MAAKKRRKKRAKARKTKTRKHTRKHKARRTPKVSSAALASYRRKKAALKRDMYAAARR